MQNLLNELDNNQTDYIYQLPNNYKLRYCLPYDKKANTNPNSRFRRAGIGYEGFTKFLLNNNKLSRPLVNLNTSYDFPIIAADFDIHPEIFSSFDEYYDYLVQTYSKDGLVIRSVSNKCKVLFQLKKEGGKETVLDPIETLKQLLNPLDFDCADQAAAATSKLFINQSMLYKLQNWHPKTIHIAATKSAYQPKEKQRSIEDLKLIYTFAKLQTSYENFNDYQNYALIHIKQLITKTFKRMSQDNITKLSIFLVIYSSNLLSGFQINQVLMSQMLDITQSACSKLLNKLVLLDLLKQSESYQAGHKSKQYKAINDLKHLLELTGKSSQKEINIQNPNISNNNANTQYLALPRKLKSEGVSEQQAIQYLINIDSQRPIDKQRPRSYFEQMVNSWYNR